MKTLIPKGKKIIDWYHGKCHNKGDEIQPAFYRPVKTKITEDLLLLEQNKQQGRYNEQGQ